MKESIFVYARVFCGLFVLGPAAAILDYACDCAGIIKSNTLLAREDNFLAEEIVRRSRYSEGVREQLGPSPILTEVQREWLKDYRNHTPFINIVEKFPILVYFKKLGPIGELIREKFYSCIKLYYKKKE